MSRAREILRINHTAGQVRRAAQKQCCGMHRDHLANTDHYRFGDGSSIKVTKNNVTIQELS